MTDKTYPVIEVFGPTIQGEGAMAGKPTHFIRMAGCDYRCHWCDTDIAVLPTKIRLDRKFMTTREIFGALMELTPGPQWITISGGNPALHDLTQVVAALHEARFKVAVETQGTLWKDWLLDVDQLTVSPKPPSSTMMNAGADLAVFITNLRTARRRIVNEKPEYMFGKAQCLKVPVFDDEDYECALRYHQAFLEFPFYFSVVTRMGGLYGDFAGGEIDTRDDILDRYRWLAEKMAGDPRAANTVAIPQLHALLWGHGRGF